MDPDFQAKANALVAASDGAIWIESGDRDTETQTRLWNEAVAKYGPEEARNWVAPPGHSNHEKGVAIDFGGDLELLARLVPQYGLYQPMSWEPWHYEPIGTRSGDPLSYTERPIDSSALIKGPTELGYGDFLAQVMNIRPYSPGPDASELIFQQAGTDPIVSGNPGFTPPPTADQLPTSGPTTTVEGTGRSPYIPGRPGGLIDIDRFMAALRDVESSGNYRAIGVPTPWGTAKGAYQFLDSTWDNYGGYATADAAPPEVQDERARQLMQNYYSEYGSWDSVAAAWYSGPGGNWESSEVQEYVGKVNSRL